MTGAFGLTEPTTRIPAKEIEDAVISCVAQAIDDPLQLITLLGVPLNPADIPRATAAAKVLAAKVRAKDTERLRTLVAHVIVRRSAIGVDLDGCHLAATLGLEPPATEIVTLTSAVRLTRTGRAVRLIQDDGRSAGQEPNMSVIKLLLRGRAWAARLGQGDIDIGSLARKEQLTPSYVTRVTRLAFLSPRVVEAILSGEQPARLDGATLIATGFPASWHEQERLFLEAHPRRA